MEARFALFLLTLFYLCLLDQAFGQKQKCKPNEFRCRKTGACIDKLLTCDGNVDCEDGTDEKVNCSDACHVNGSVVVDSGVTTQDEDWWYACSRSRWRAAGCVVNGRRYAVGQTFSGYQNDFWGKCEKLGPNYLRRHLYGCVDYKGRLVEPGEQYLIDSLFWANCSSHNTTTEVVGLGNVTLNGVRRQIIGCNDGTDEPVPNGEEFLEIGDESSGLGVALQCRLSGSEEWPQVVPVACIIGNETNRNEFVGLSNGCFETFGSTVYYCSIQGKIDVSRLDNNRLNGTWRYNWQLSWNNTSPETIKKLEDDGFLRCPADDADLDQQQSGPTPARQKGGNKKKETPSSKSKSRAKRNASFKLKIGWGAKKIFNSVIENQFLGYVNDAQSNLSPL
jgi:hypothetical protein